MKKLDRWRIDNVYEKVYVPHGDVYIHYGSFYACGITKEMSLVEQLWVLDNEIHMNVVDLDLKER